MCQYHKMQYGLGVIPLHLVVCAFARSLARFGVGAGLCTVCLYGRRRYLPSRHARRDSPRQPARHEQLPHSAWRYANSSRSLGYTEVAKETF
jgi:hypothetical protein